MTDDHPTAVLDDPDLDDVAATIRSLYRALGDRAAFDAHLDPAITIWESDADGLLGLAELDALRDARAGRAAAAPAPPLWVRPEHVVVDRWVDVAVVRFVLRARATDGPDETFRVTDVLRREDGTWRIVHHHAERWPAAGRQPDATSPQD